MSSSKKGKPTKTFEVKRLQTREIQETKLTQLGYNTCYGSACQVADDWKEIKCPDDRKAEIKIKFNDKKGALMLKVTINTECAEDNDGVPPIFCSFGIYYMEGWMGVFDDDRLTVVEKTRADDSDGVIQEDQKKIFKKIGKFLETFDEVVLPDEGDEIPDKLKYKSDNPDERENDFFAVVEFPSLEGLTKESLTELYFVLVDLYYENLNREGTEFEKLVPFPAIQDIVEEEF